MSNLPRAQPDPKLNSAPEQGRAGYKIAFLALLAAVGLITLAYFDGGEKPIRPIVQQVEVPANKAQDNAVRDGEKGQ